MKKLLIPGVLLCKTHKLKNARHFLVIIAAILFSACVSNDAVQLAMTAYGLILMSIAGYNPEDAAPFWERMSATGGGAPPEFLSTHPSHSTRIRQLQGWTPEAKEKAAEFGVWF